VACDCDPSGRVGDGAGTELGGSSSVAGGSVRTDDLVGVGNDAVTLAEGDKDRDASPCGRSPDTSPPHDTSSSVETRPPTAAAPARLTTPPS
jgi:hypothetical protein